MSTSVERKIILLVDDDSLFRSSVKAILQKDGFQVIEAGDGIEAYQIIIEDKTSIDLLLTDILMPRMGGLELAESVTTIHPDMPILFMTGQVLSLDGPMKGYTILRKPFPRQALIDAVRQLIAATLEP
jgi:CheY-like chemotaxis protein